MVASARHRYSDLVSEAAWQARLARRARGFDVLHHLLSRDVSLQVADEEHRARLGHEEPLVRIHGRRVDVGQGDQPVEIGRER